MKQKHIKTILADSGHTFWIGSIDEDDLPDGFEHSEVYDKFYVVRNWDESGPIFFYLGKNSIARKKEVVVWYRKSKSMWTGFGATFEYAIRGAMKDGWLFA